MSGPMIDLRSDTVTKPSPAMRRAMADAEVGDDVLDGDPTTRRFEERTAEILGQERALFFVHEVDLFTPLHGNFDPLRRSEIAESAVSVVEEEFAQLQAHSDAQAFSFIVRAGIAEAQRQEAVDWVAAYQHWVGPLP